jgi:hypothetical protein
VKEGCFKSFFTSIGCLTVAIVVVVGGWIYRPQLAGLYRSIVGGEPPFGIVSGDTTIGRPSPEALRAAERKEFDIGSARGAGYVTLSADEVASLIQSRLTLSARQAVDSLQVLLSEDRVTLRGDIRLELFSRDLLGPLAELLGSRQQLRMGGPAAIEDTGMIAWRCDEFVIRAFPFPPSAIPKLVNRLTGGTGGAFLIPVPPTVGEVRVRADGITLYRQAQ